MTEARDNLQERLARIAGLDAEEVWPVPQAHFILDKGTVAEMIRASLREPKFLGGQDIPEASATGRRNLSVTYLLAAASERRNLREPESLAYFTRAADLENPISEVAWYLARHEVDRARGEISSAAST